MQSTDTRNEELWQQLRGGSQKAIEELYRFNYQVLYSYAFKICRDKDLSKDCVQELFVHLWEKKEKLSDVSRVRSYLLQSIWHSVVKRLKKDNKLLSIDENAHYGIDIVFSQEHLIIKKQTKKDNIRQLHDAFGKLSVREKEILFMQYYEGLTIDEIQQITELKYQSIKNLTHRAMTSLRDSFNVKKKLAINEYRIQTAISIS
ncbi:MAG: sigma-70 family RNA polymerase sigma factor [Cyclobacteriaceae bacterium]|nr:sigma-70 family RNA polymerase sigma factor [Cyclobacteriaceae bacterium]